MVENVSFRKIFDAASEYQKACEVVSQESQTSKLDSLADLVESLNHELGIVGSPFSFVKSGSEGYNLSYKNSGDYKLSESFVIYWYDSDNGEVKFFNSVYDRETNIIRSIEEFYQDLSKFILDPPLRKETVKENSKVKVRAKVTMKGTGNPLPFDDNDIGW